MRYEEFAIDPLLVPYIQVIWRLDVDKPAEFGPPERIMPDGFGGARTHRLPRY